MSRADGSAPELHYLIVHSTWSAWTSATGFEIKIILSPSCNDGGSCLLLRVYCPLSWVAFSVLVWDERHFIYLFFDPEKSHQNIITLVPAVYFVISVFNGTWYLLTFMTSSHHVLWNLSIQIGLLIANVSMLQRFSLWDLIQDSITLIYRSQSSLY